MDANSDKQQIRFCTTSEGVRIAYAIAGKGVPLLKTPSWFSHLQFDWRSLVWRHWHAELSRHNTYCRYDRRGCGLSDWNVDHSFENYFSDLEAVVDALRLDRFVLLGIGHGGPLAVAYAARYPSRVSELILYGTYARGRSRRNPSPRQTEEIEMNYKLADLGWDAEDPSFRQFFTAQFMPDATAEQMRAFAGLQRVSTQPGFAVAHLRAVFDLDVTSLAPHVRCPTLVLHAREDLRSPFEEGRLLASLIPGARFVPLESRNHLLQKEDPAWPQLVDEIRAFLPSTRPALTANRKLTVREEEVLDFIARGLDNAQIAAWLEVSEKTVRNHITGVFSKLGVATRAQAIVRAREAGYPRRPHNQG